jgi:hypothetical protein
MNHTNDPHINIVAEKQVEAFIAILSRRYGLSEEDIPDIIDNMKWIAKHRNKIENATVYAFLTLLGLLMIGMATAFWEGFKAMLRGK